jgi:hypothetical protein
LSNNVSRIRAILTHISWAQDQKYGGRQMGQWLLSSLAQVYIFSGAHNSNQKLSKFLKPGTGGTVAGTGQYLKSMDPDVFVAIADPEGSGLYNKVICYFLSKAGFWNSQ